MEDSLIYKDVAVELLEIFKYIDRKIYEKIPSKIIVELEKNKNKEYHFTIDKNVSLEEQKIKKETKSMLSWIFLKYCVSKEERKEILAEIKKKQLIEEHDEEDKYTVDVFKNTPLEETKKENIELMVVETKPWYKKIINKIVNFFKR